MPRLALYRKWECLDGHIRGHEMNTEPAFYKMAEVEAKLNLHYQTIRRLIREGILIASGRGTYFTAPPKS